MPCLVQYELMKSLSTRSLLAGKTEVGDPAVEDLEKLGFKNRAQT